MTDEQIITLQLPLADANKVAEWLGKQAATGPAHDAVHLLYMQLCDAVNVP